MNITPRPIRQCESYFSRDLRSAPTTYADNKTVYWLDLEDVFVDEEGILNRELMPDGLHPNIPGYQAWAKAMEPMVKQLLGE